MNILITGATGFIGKQLSIKLLKVGHQLTVIGRDKEYKFRQGFTFPCHYYSWDQWKNLNISLDIDVVIHLAGASIAGGRWSQKRKQSILNSRVESTKKLLNYFKTHHNWPKTFISASAIGYYGSQKDCILNESSGKGTGFLADVCAIWENSSLEFAQYSRRVILRFGLVLHPKDGFLKQLEPLFSMGLGGKVGSGKHYMSWIHLSDLLEIVSYVILNQNLSGPINVTSPHPVQNLIFTQIYAKQLKRSAFLSVPSMILKLTLGEMSQLALDSQKVQPQCLLAHAYSFKFKTLDHALNDLYAWQNSANEKIFETEQWLDKKIDQVFPFFSEAKNLESITPSTLQFKILNQSTQNLQKGTLIHYKLKIHKIPVRWQTLIKDWKPNEMFIDTQLKGPYKKWQHLHMFEPLAHGTLIKDRVIYEIPWARFGRLFLGFFIRENILKIFKFRQSKTQERFLSNHNKF